MTSLPPPILVRDPNALAELAGTLARAATVAVDTESNSLHAYRERVCLIQFSLPGRDYLLDTLAVSALNALKPILRDPGIEKVFHAAEYDLICLRRDFAMEIRNLFDTMVAAGTLGWKKVGLASLLEERYGVIMNKRLQRADWGRRPLTEEQLAYARLDTHYLIRLRNELETELKTAGRWEEAREEFERIALTPSPDGLLVGRAPSAPLQEGFARARGEAFWRIAGARDLKPQQQAVLRELPDLAWVGN